MILACPFCRARFLVQASLFDAGPRQVKCARCHHEWLDDGREPQTPEAPPGMLAEGLGVAASQPGPDSPPAEKKPGAPAKKAAYLDFVVVAIRALPPIPPLSSLPPKTARIVKLAGIGFAGLIFLMFFIFARAAISDVLRRAHQAD